MKLGDRLRLFGGYDPRPEWLGEGGEVVGTLEDFIPGQNREPAALVRLDTPIEVEGTGGAVLVLELRYVGASWAEEGIVHVELCDFEPERKRWQDRRQGRWVESHASYERLGERSADSARPPARTGLRPVVERELERYDPSIVELVRNVQGPRPFKDQPRSTQIFIIAFLGGPLLLVFFAEWAWRQVIPLWISLPLTLVALAWSVLRSMRKGHGSGERDGET